MHSALCSRVMLNIRGAGRLMHIGARSRIQDYGSSGARAGAPELAHDVGDTTGEVLDTVEFQLDPWDRAHGGAAEQPIRQEE